MLKQKIIMYGLKQNIDNYKVVEESIYQSKLGRVFTLIRKLDFEDELDLNWDF